MLRLSAISPINASKQKEKGIILYFAAGPECVWLAVSRLVLIKQYFIVKQRHRKRPRKKGFKFPIFVLSIWIIYQSKMPLSAGRLFGYRQQCPISCALCLELGVVLPAESRWSWQTVRCGPSSHITTSTCHFLFYMKCTVLYSGWIQVSILWTCDWDLSVFSGVYCDVFTGVKSSLRGPETARLI